MRLALVARIEQRKWTTCAVYDRMDYGLSVGDRLDMGATHCDDAPLTLSAAPRPLPRKHAEPEAIRFGSYVSVPIYKPNGRRFGTLCALDSELITITPDLDTSLEALAKLLEQQLAAEDEKRELEEALREERDASRLREEFIAVLAHDLRNPLGGILGATNLLEDLQSGPEQTEMLSVIRSSSHRISGLIDDVLDFAWGRLGGGIPLARRASSDVSILASEAIDELCSAHPGRVVHLRHSGPVMASIDTARVRQLISNLIANALQHGPSAEAVSIELGYDGKWVRLAVTNGGEPLSTECKASLFSPFSNRGNSAPGSSLGLGLFIASEIARSHGGTIKAASDKRGTTFSVRLPRSSVAD